MRETVLALLLLPACLNGADSAPDYCASVPEAQVLSFENTEGYTDQLPQGVAVDADHVYWVDFQGDRVRRVLKTGGTAETLAEEGLVGAPQKVTVDDEYVYWIGGLGPVTRVGKAGGDVEVISTGRGCSDFPCGESIALDADSIYWVDGDGLRTRPKAGGAVVDLVGDAVYTKDVIADDLNLYWGAVELLESGPGFAIRSSPKGGGDFQTLAVLPAEAYAFPAFQMTADATNLYVAFVDGLWRVPKNGGDPELARCDDGREERIRRVRVTDPSHLAA